MFRKSIKVFISVIALALAFAMGLGYPLQVSAESIPQYVKEIKMVTASTKDEAFKKLEDAGYTVCDFNIRDGVSGNVCYMGYKSTTDSSEAITDIRLMNAKGGITEEKYRDKKKQMTTGLASTTEYFKAACLELKSKYEAGSPLASAAVDILNVFDFDGTKLSDYLFSTDRTDADYEDIVLICADNVVSAIYSAIMLGCADYGDAEGNFAERLEKADVSKFEYSVVEASEDNEEYAADWDYVERILDNLQEFGATYDEGKLYFEENADDLKEQYGVEDTSDGELTDEEETQYWKTFVDDYFKNSEDTEEQDLYKYANALGTYEKLKNYTSPDSQYGNLAEYIYACTAVPGKTDEEVKKQVYSIYPLVEALSEGQIFTLQYGGVETLVNTLDNNTEAQAAKITTVADEVKTKVQSNGVDTVSIFYNVNRDIYDKTVCFTDEATKEATSASSYDKLTYQETDDEITQNLTKAVLICGMMAASILALTALTLSITAFVAGTTMGTLLSVGFTAIMAGSIGVAMGGMTLTTGAVVMGIIGVAAVALTIIFIAIIVVCVLWMVIKKVVENEKEEEETMPAIPEQIYDVVSGDFVCYDAVTDTDGNSVNFTCRDAVREQWDVMYTSTDAKAGNPIEVNNGQIFNYYTEVTAVPSDSVPVRRFEATDAANFNSFQSNPGHPLYLSYNGSETGKEEEEGDETYIYSLDLAVESSAEAARLYLSNKGFTPIEQNITPYSGKVSYIGYKTTTDPNDAITDIRVAYYYSGDEFSFGTLKSGIAAKYTKFGTLNTEASLYYTKQHSNGTPIYPDIKITTETLGADSGYEAVNMFSGGEAFNFVNGSDNYNNIRCLDDNWNDKLYIYFRPSVSYGSSSPEYLSGFAFSSGYSDCIASARMCGFKVVPVLDGYDLTDGLTEQPTYMLYSTTHNPYRAITEIRTYEAGNKATGLYENMSLGSVGFAACETFACISVDRTLDYWNSDKHRLIRPSNGFITRLTYEGAVDTYLDSDLEAMNTLGYYDSVPMTGLYVAGPNENKTPLTFDDVYFSTDRYDTDRTSFTNSNGETVACRPVNDLTDCYSTSAKNLTFEWDYDMPDPESDYTCSVDITFSHFLRMYYKGSVPTRGKYVKNVIVASVDPDENSKNYSYDQAMAKLLSYGEGEIKKINFSRSRSSQPNTYSTYTDSNGKTVTRETVRDFTGKSTYIMVTYTDTLIGSMRNIMTDWNSDDVNNKPNKIKVSGADFVLCGDKALGQSGDYLFYSSSNGYFGSAITDIIADGNYIVNGCTTTRAIDNSVHTGEDFVLKMKYENNKVKAYVKNVCVSSQKSKEACLSDLYARGCTAYVDQEKNEGLGGKYIYVGYDTTNDIDDPDIITGIQCKAYSSKNNTQSYTDTDGSYYYRITGDMNDSRGGDYTYLYLTKSKVQHPIIALSSYYLMCLTKEDYIDYVSNNWVNTTNLSSGTKNTTILCYKQTTADWTIENGVLTISTDGDMPDYQYYTAGKYYPIIHDGRSWYFSSEYENFMYPKSPEWSEYNDLISEVVVKDTVTRFDNCALLKLSHIKKITFEGAETTIDDNLFFPYNATFYVRQNSPAYTYAAKNNRRYEIITGNAATVLGTGNIAVISAISGTMVVIGLAAIYFVKRRKKAVTGEVPDENKEQ